MRSLIALIVLALALSGCSSEEKTEPGIGAIALELARSRIGRNTVEEAEVAKPTARPTREQLAAAGRPVIWFAVPRFGMASPALELARNAGFDTYMSGDQTSVTLRDGMIMATRGLLVDLHAQDLSIAPINIFRGEFPKQYTRTQRHLTGEGTLSTLTYDCAIAPEPEAEQIEVFGQTHTTTRLTELCRNTARAFRNDYWIDSRSRRVIKTNQSVSKEVGHVSVEVVTPGT